MALTDAGFLSSPFIVPPFPQKPLQASRYFSDSSVSSTTSPMSQRERPADPLQNLQAHIFVPVQLCYRRGGHICQLCQGGFFHLLSISNFHSRLYWTAIRFISRLVYRRQYSAKNREKSMDFYEMSHIFTNVKPKESSRSFYRLLLQP